MRTGIEIPTVTIASNMSVLPFDADMRCASWPLQLAHPRREKEQHTSCNEHEEVGQVMEVGKASQAIAPGAGENRRIGWGGMEAAVSRMAALVFAIEALISR